MKVNCCILVFFFLLFSREKGGKCLRLLCNPVLKWSTGFFIGVNGRTTEYLVATQEGIFACATIRRLPDDEAYDPACIDIVKVTYREYVLEGARSTPVVVRFGGDQVQNVDTEPITAPMIPRRATQARGLPRTWVYCGMRRL